MQSNVLHRTVDLGQIPERVDLRESQIALNSQLKCKIILQEESFAEVRLGTAWHKNKEKLPGVSS